MRDEIRAYFREMLNEGYGVDSALDNLMDLVAEIAAEFRDGDDE